MSPRAAEPRVQNVRELVGEVFLRASERHRVGSAAQWAHAAREAVNLYFTAVERDPDGNFTLTLSKGGQ